MHQYYLSVKIAEFFHLTYYGFFVSGLPVQSVYGPVDARKPEYLRDFIVTVSVRRSEGSGILSRGIFDGGD